MLYFVIGLPGRFTTWCSSVVAALGSRSAAPCPVVEANTLGDIARALLRGNASHMVISAQAPGSRLRSVLAAVDRPLVIAQGDPRRACAELGAAGLPVAAAVRQVASSCGAIRDFAPVRSVLMLQADLDATNPTATVRKIADHFGLAIADRDLVRVLDEVGPASFAEDSAFAERWWNDLADSEHALLRGALSPYLPDAADPHAVALYWPADLFLQGDRPGESAAGAIDITGRARCLLHGPYILLPSGNWSLALIVGFSREAADNEFLVEVATDSQLASARLRPHQESQLTAQLSFTIDDSSDHPIAIRLSTQRAAFDGLVRLRGASLLRHEPS
jgi:hypothetical protein